MHRVVVQRLDLVNDTTLVDVRFEVLVHPAGRPRPTHPGTSATRLSARQTSAEPWAPPSPLAAGSLTGTAHTVAPLADAGAAGSLQPTYPGTSAKAQR